MFGLEWNNYQSFGFLFALLLALWAIFSIVQNKEKGPFSKALWSIIVLFIPYIGFIAWILFGPKAPKV